jgi:hypothetical protein
MDIPKQVRPIQRNPSRIKNVYGYGRSREGKEEKVGDIHKRKEGERKVETEAESKKTRCQ